MRKLGYVEASFTIEDKHWDLLWRPDDRTDWVPEIATWYWLRDEILKVRKQARVLITAGGCCGLYPILWAPHFEEVVTFECDPRSFQCLAHNALDHTENVTAHYCALGDSSGFCGIETHAFNAGATRVVQGNTVPMTQIDDLGMDNVDVIQLDTEGTEWRVIKGALETIKASWPVISVETCVPGLRKLLDGLGYKLIAEGVDLVFAHD